MENLERSSVLRWRVFLDPYASQLGHVLLKLISETNGITLAHTLDLALRSMIVEERPEVAATLREFQDLVHGFHRDPTDSRTLLDHDVARDAQPKSKFGCGRFRVQAATEASVASPTAWRQASTPPRNEDT